MRYIHGHIFHFHTCCPYLIPKYFDVDISRIKKCFDLGWFSNCIRSIFNSRTCVEKVDRELQHSVWLTTSLRYWNELWRKFPIFQTSSIKTRKSIFVLRMHIQNLFLKSFWESSLAKCIALSLLVHYYLYFRIWSKRGNLY